ncbi:MAG: hypothetical protein HQK79_12295 [Desulfobacterales bacterium]|nr:hypothetical protein [Desulfobacterales bacterium]
MNYYKDIIHVIVPANIKLLNIIKPMLRTLCMEIGINKENSNKIEFATEEIFSYCVKLINFSNIKYSITVSFQVISNFLNIFIEHNAPRGSLEKHFIEGVEEKIPRTSFEALGLYVAKEIIDELKYTYFASGKSRFILKIKIS